MLKQLQEKFLQPHRLELLRVRFPYNWFDTVWLVPEYSTVLATTSVLVYIESGKYWYHRSLTLHYLQR